MNALDGKQDLVFSNVCIFVSQVSNSTVCFSTIRLVRFHPKVGYIGPKWDNSGTFWLKTTFKKSQNYPFGANLTSLPTISSL